MFGITYESWKSVCEMYFSLKTGVKKAYLQWYPLSKISASSEEYFKSEEFYDTYISSGAFVMHPEIMHRTENFMQKGDGSFRDSSLVSIFLFLILQCIGKEIHGKYVSNRSEDFLVYYAGNYEKMRPRYKQDYDEFFKILNSSIEEYNYFIKTDITNFFPNINIDKLLNQIDKVCNLDSIKITQTELLLYKELLLYAGEGKFPLIENSLASSYLATEVYLDEIDCRLEQYFSKLSDIHRVKFVRYVDDLYILISTDMDEVEMHKIYNSVRNEYSSILKDFNLSLNAKKCCWKPTYKINDELKKSLYDEFFNGEKHSIETIFQGKFLDFLEDIELELFLDCVDVEKYNHYLEKHFSSNDVEFTASEVFNYFIYESDNELKLPEVVLKIREIIEQDISFISLDPKRLTVMVMKTHDAKTIKAMLSKLFSRGREELWNSYDTSIAISYLIQRQFKHKDLLDALETNCLDIYKFYAENCKYDFCENFKDEEVKNYIKIIKNDWKTYYLYFMYKVELEKHNNMSAYAYFKNYFDCISAHLAFVTKWEKDLKEPNYNNYYKEGNLKRLYKGIEDSENVIPASHKLRNSNPISHSSAGLIDDNSSSSKLMDSIKELNKLIKGFCDNHKNEIESL